MAGKVFLRPLQMGDLERTHRWHNDRDLYRRLGTPFRTVSLAAEREWLAGRCDCGDDEVNLAICLAANDEHIGNIYLRNINWTARNGELSIFIAVPEWRRKGYGRCAVNALLQQAFTVHKLQRVYLHVVADNDAAIAFYESCGFKNEGRLMRCLREGDEPTALFTMGIHTNDIGRP